MESNKRPLKEGGTTGNRQVDDRLKEVSSKMNRENPKAANIHNDFQSRPERESKNRWPVDE